MSQEPEITRAVSVLRAGGLVAFPTETVYGLGADADNPAAIAKVFAAKGRPANHPVIVHLARAEQVAEWACDIPPDAWKLASAFWPGPLTLILPRQPRVLDAVTGGQDSVGLRVPSHPVAQQLLTAFGGGVIAPSANRFGRVSPTCAAHVRDELGSAADLVLDGGACTVGLESTIVNLSQGAPSLLRPGGITREQIEAVLGHKLDDPGHNRPRVSGGLESHYAPQARIIVAPREERVSRAVALTQEIAPVALLAPERTHVPPGVLLIPLPDDEVSFAQQLYAALREADRLGCAAAVISPPAGAGLGEAIWDRLKKASAPKA